MDWVWSSKTGSKLKPAFSDFQTPPVAAPTQMVTGSVAFPSMAAIRPLMTAGPMARALRPPKVAESIVSPAWITPIPVKITAINNIVRTL